MCAASSAKIAAARMKWRWSEGNQDETAVAFAWLDEDWNVTSPSHPIILIVGIFCFALSSF
jgi:hypothetical protein